jgi:hypothetical protein
MTEHCNSAVHREKKKIVGKIMEKRFLIPLFIFISLFISIDRMFRILLRQKDGRDLFLALDDLRRGRLANLIMLWQR